MASIIKWNNLHRRYKKRVKKCEHCGKRIQRSYESYPCCQTCHRTITREMF